MKNYFLSFAAVICFFTAAFAQPSKYGNTWLTGSGGSILYYLNFSDTGLVMTVSDTPTFKNRGTVLGSYASNICDANGNLLMVTNGYRLWGKVAHVRMDNGDTIAEVSNTYGFSPSSARQDQRTIILPVGDSLYYVFACTPSKPYLDGQKGLPVGGWDLLHYSIVDMKANNYAGKVISKKHMVMTDSSLTLAEMTAVRHGNGKDWWLVKRGIHRDGFDSSIFYVFKVKKDSVLGPIIQKFGVPASTGSGLGQSVFSPSGRKFVSASGTNRFFLADFDRCTGLFSNVQNAVFPMTTVSMPTFSTTDIFVRGLAFSPNDTFLYISSTYSISQFNMASANWAATRQVVGEFDSTNSPLPYGTLYLAPNGKIYITPYYDQRPFWSVIDNPNLSGAACGFCARCLRFPNPIRVLGNGDTTYWGAVSSPPGNMPNYGLEAVQNGCSGITDATAGMLFGPNITQIDPGSSLCQGSAFTIHFSATGFNANNVFTAQLSNQFGSFANPTTIGTVSGSYGTAISALIPTNQLLGSGYRIRIVASSPSRVGLDNGTDILVNARPVAAQSTVSPSGTQSICPGSSTLFTAPADTNLTYQWLLNGLSISGATNNTYTATQAGTHSVLVTNRNGCSRPSGNRVVTLKPQAPAVISPNTVQNVCSGQSVAFQANTGTGLSYQWRNNDTAIAGATQMSYQASLGGSYTVAVTNSSGCVTTSAATVLNATSTCVTGPTITKLNPSSSLCQGAPVTIDFTASGFGIGNVFTVQLSNSAGSFANPTTLATLSDSVGAQVTATLSANQGLGSGYRIRVVGSSPATTGLDNGLNLTVSAVPTSGQVSISPTNQSICPGGSATFTVPGNAGFSYQWQQGGVNISGATGTSYTTGIVGSYRAQVQNGAGCGRLTTARNVTLKAKPGAVSISPSGTVASPALLTASASGTGLTWQWFQSGQAIAGATNKTYLAAGGGTYTVVATKASTGCSEAATAPVLALRLGVESGSAKMLVYPNPAQEGAEVLVQSDDASAGYEVRVMDAWGRVLRKLRVQAGEAASVGSDLAPGVYTIEAIGERTRLVEKWVKQ